MTTDGLRGAGGAEGTFPEQVSGLWAKQSRGHKGQGPTRPGSLANSRGLVPPCSGTCPLGPHLYVPARLYAARRTALTGQKNGSIRVFSINQQLTVTPRLLAKTPASAVSLGSMLSA